jgi:hypothetical protein
MYNPSADCVVLIDEKTKANLIGKRAGYEQVVSEIKVIKVPDEFSQKEASRWIKTSINRHVEGDFLFIDCDTVIADKLDCDFSEKVKIGAVLDCHVTLSDHHYRDIFKEDNKKLGFESTEKSDAYYNGGMIFFRNCLESVDFFEKWHALWLASREKGSSQDMPPLNQANYESHNIITDIGGEWNCQISYNGLPYLNNAKIIHYFATSLVTFEPSYLPGSNAVLSLIKDSGVISNETLEMLRNPRAAFNTYSRIVADKNALDVLNSSLFYKLLWLRKKHYKLFRKIDMMTSKITTLIKSKHNKQ